jgi:hypothetical protein
MSVLGKLRSPEERSSGSAGSPRGATPASLRRSNGLKDFLWLMPEVEQGRLLDLGPVAQSTVMFFTDRGFRVTTEDLVRTWAEFEAERKAERERDASAEAPRNSNGGGRAQQAPPEPPTPAELAANFLERNLHFEPESFHAVLVWDVLDYLEPDFLGPLVERLYQLMAPGGVLLAAFHDSMEVEPVSYRVRDNETVDMVPARHRQPIRHVFQNREILALFEGFRSSRTYVGRDHLREALFLK